MKSNLLLKRLPADSVDVVFLDPPFNIGKDYGKGKSKDKLPPQKYDVWLKNIIRESYRVLKPGGAMFIYHLPETATRLTGYLNKLLDFRHWIAISMKSTFARGRRLYPAHYALLYYTKGAPGYFNRPKIEPERCRKCGELLKDYGGYWSIIQEKGLNLCDVWTDLSPVRHTKKKHRDANELPMLLFDRILDISGFENGLYLDPFAGSGNGVMSAINHGMKFIACDINVDYCHTVTSRIEKLKD